MTPTIAATIFRSAIRIGRTAHDAFEQYALERPFLVPDADRLGLNIRTEILRLRDANETFHNDLEDNDKLGRLWNNGGPSEVDEKVLFEITHEYARREIDAASEIGTRSASEISGGLVEGCRKHGTQSADFERGNFRSCRSNTESCIGEPGADPGRDY